MSIVGKKFVIENKYKGWPRSGFKLKTVHFEATRISELNHELDTVNIELRIVETKESGRNYEMSASLGLSATEIKDLIMAIGGQEK